MKIFLTTMLGILMLAGCAIAQDITGRAKVTDENTSAELPTTKPAMIYVRDFDLEAAGIKQEKRRLMSGSRGDGLRHRLRGGSGDSDESAQKLVDMMSETLVADIKKRGIPARRLYADEKAPKNGWLVRGIFTEVDEGNRLRRSVIGFGSGATKIDLHVNVTDLTSNAVRPFYSVDTKKSSGKMPGAVITLNPYVAAAKFVLSKNALERDLKGTASKIADQLVEQVKRIEQGNAMKTH
jgi:hypothetical protein